MLPHLETTGFYMRVTLAFNGLNKFALYEAQI